jgi:ABC-type dipeptide/oligopeptide/nickel transport system permease component
MISNYITRRIAHLIPTLFIVSFLVFALVRMIPGDPVTAIAGIEAPPEVIEKMRSALGLDKPIFTQYFLYLKGILQGDFGTSLRTHQSVWSEIWRRLPATTELAVAGMIVSLTFGIILGVVAGLRPGNLADTFARGISLFGVSSPTFWTGLLFVLAFGYYWRLFPIAGSGELRHLVLPAVTVSLTSLAFITRLTRANMMEVLSEDYIRTARAKGLSPVRIVLKHALRNALIAPLTVAGLELGRLISGVIVIEIIFAWPGIGKLLIDSIQFRDWPLIQGLILTFALIFALVNVVVDLTYVILDPRITLESEQN